MQIGYVKGVDLSENEILEAQKRYNDAKLERTGTPHLSTQACSSVVQESVQHVHAHHNLHACSADVWSCAADFGNFTAKFVCHDKLGQADFPPSTGQYDVVTCMFAIHYFFHTEATAHQFLRNVAHNLKPGMHLAARLICIHTGC